MLEEALRFGLDLPIVWIFQGTPLIDQVAKLVDDRSRIILLGFGGEPLVSISEIRSGLNSRPSQSWTGMVEAMNPELPPVDTWS
jgi:hypothetical protein